MCCVIPTWRGSFSPMLSETVLHVSLSLRAKRSNLAPAEPGRSGLLRRFAPRNDEVFDDVWELPMKAILLSRTGDPSVLEYVELPTPRPAEGEVLVRADTIGVCMPEILVRKGTYAWMPPLPAIPGIEMSGSIVECGGGVTDRAVGQGVFVSARDLPVRAGCYAEYIAVPTHAAHPLPPGTDLEAASCLSNYQ